ncbi:hypothetical protein BSPWISOXPB_3394, partial [uncultured Gammaproteobacteria bacterium]
KKTEAGILKTFIAIAFKKISYPLSTISYPYQQLVTLSSTISYPLLASHSTGYFIRNWLPIRNWLHFLILRVLF